MIPGCYTVDAVRVELAGDIPGNAKTPCCIFTVCNDKIDIFFTDESRKGEKERFSARFTDYITYHHNMYQPVIQKQSRYLSGDLISAVEISYAKHASIRESFQ